MQLLATHLRQAADIPGLRLPGVAPGREHVWHLYVVDHDSRDELQKHLATRGIQTLVHYPIPPHLSGAFAPLGLTEGTFSIAERAARTHLSLPIGPHLSEENVTRGLMPADRFAHDSRKEGTHDLEGSQRPMMWARCRGFGVAEQGWRTPAWRKVGLHDCYVHAPTPANELHAAMIASTSSSPSK
jgi:DegT/DnrJ/EryC1/StrS aminotransferase family